MTDNYRAGIYRIYGMKEVTGAGEPVNIPISIQHRRQSSTCEPIRRRNAPSQNYWVS